MGNGNLNLGPCAFLGSALPAGSAPSLALAFENVCVLPFTAHSPDVVGLTVGVEASPGFLGGRSRGEGLAS